MLGLRGGAREWVLAAAVLAGLGAPAAAFVSVGRAVPARPGRGGTLAAHPLAAAGAQPVARQADRRRRARACRVDVQVWPPRLNELSELAVGHH